jgi:hypothetical protein
MEKREQNVCKRDKEGEGKSQGAKNLLKGLRWRLKKVVDATEIKFDFK